MIIIEKEVNLSCRYKIIEIIWKMQIIMFKCSKLSILDMEVDIFEFFLLNLQGNVRIHIPSGSELSMKSEFQGKSLSEIIEEWMKDHTANQRYNIYDAADKHLLFNQVYIYLKGENKEPLDTYKFVSNLSSFLSSPPYNISSKIIMKGLGKANLILDI